MGRFASVLRFPLLIFTAPGYSEWAPPASRRASAPQVLREEHHSRAVEAPGRLALQDSMLIFKKSALWRIGWLFVLVCTGSNFWGGGLLRRLGC